MTAVLAHTPEALLRALLASRLLVGYSIQVGAEALDRPFEVCVTYRDADDDKCSSLGAGDTMEAAVSLALRDCPADVQVACAPAMLRFSVVHFAKETP